MKIIITLVVLLIVNSQTTHSSVCVSRVRLLNDDVNTTDLGHDVIVQNTTFAPGDVIRVTLTSPKSSRFRGITAVMMSQNEIAGDWFPPVRGLERHYDVITCGGKRNAMLIERHFKPKRVQNVGGPTYMTWASPMQCSDGQDFSLRVVVKENRRLKQHINVPMRCFNVKKTQICPFPTQGLDYIDYTTSFETGKSSSWVDTGHRRWSLTRSPTPSRYTGPQSAYDGEYYVYSETSFPARFNSQAIMTSYGWLRGCFCLNFAFSFNVRRSAGHVLEVRANQVTVFRTTDDDVGLNWQRKVIQFNENLPVKVSIVATRGSDYLGDVAIDDISLYKGFCTELTS